MKKLLLLLTMLLLAGIICFGAIGYTQSDNRKEYPPELIVKYYSAMLKDKNNPLNWREQAAKKLGKVGGPDAVTALSDALKDSSPSVRLTAIDVLISMKDPVALEALLSHLKVDNIDMDLVSGLSRISDPEIANTFIIVMKKHKDPVLRLKAAWAASIIGQTVVKPLIEMLRDQDKDSRHNAELALLSMRNPKDVEPLIDVLDERNSALRDTAYKILVYLTGLDFGAKSEKWRDWWFQIKDDKKKLDSLWDRLRRSAKVTLTPIEVAIAVEDFSSTIPKDIREEIERLSSLDEAVLLDTVNRLSALKERAMPALKPLLALYSRPYLYYSVKPIVITALAQMGHPAIESLIQALDSANENIRYASATALGEIGDPKALQALSILLHEDTEEHVRASAAVALGKINDAAAVEALITALKDEKVFVRSKAAHALGEIADSRAVAPFIEMIKSERRSSPVIEAIIALGKIGNDKAVVHLIALTDDRLFMDYEKPLSEALVKIGKPAVEPLIVTLMSKPKNAKVVIFSIETLGEIGDPRAVEPLAHILRYGIPQKDPILLLIDRINRRPSTIFLRRPLVQLEARRAAIVALGKIGKPAEAFLKEALIRSKLKVIREAAADALQKIEHPTVEDLISDLSDKNKKIRAAAKYTLIKLTHRDFGEDVTKWQSWWAENKEEFENFYKRVVETKKIDYADLPKKMRKKISDIFLSPPYSNDRRKAIYFLATDKDHGTLEPLIYALNDESYDTRKEAIDALGQRKDSRAIEPLIYLLNDHEVIVRMRAADALKAITGKDFGEDAAKWKAWLENPAMAEPVPSQESKTQTVPQVPSAEEKTVPFPMVISKDDMIRDVDVIAIVKIIKREYGNLWQAEVERVIKGNPKTKITIVGETAPYGLNVKEQDRYLVFLKANGWLYDIYGERRWKYSFLEIRNDKVQWDKSRDLDAVIAESFGVLSQPVIRLQNTAPAEVWTANLEGNYTYSYAAAGELVIVGVRDKYNQEHLEARRIVDGSLVWLYEKGGVFGPACNGNIIVSSRKEIIAVDTKTGKEQWNFTPKTTVNDRKTAWWFASPAALDGENLYIADNYLYYDGSCKTGSVGPSNFYCLNAATGKELWRLEIPTGAIGGSVSFDERNIYVVREFGFSCISKKERRISWSNNMLNTMRSSAYPNRDSVIVPVHGLQCFSVKDGKLIWEMKGIPNDYSGRLIDGILYTVLPYSEYEQHYFAAIQADTGEIIWQCKFPNQVRGGAAFDGANIYLTCWDNNLYCLDRQTGHIRWQYPIQLAQWAPTPIVTNKGILLCFKDKIVCLGQKEKIEKEAQFDKNAPLTLRIKSDKRVYEEGEPIIITVTVTNISKEKVSFCTQYFAPPRYLLQKGICDVYNSKNERISVGLPLQPAVLEKKDYIILEAGQNKSYTFDLHSAPMRQLKPETYTIQYYYYGKDSYWDKDAIQREMAFKKVEYHWRGTIVSNSISIKVEKKVPVGLSIRPIKVIHEMGEKIGLHVELAPPYPDKRLFIPWNQEKPVLMLPEPGNTIYTIRTLKEPVRGIQCLTAGPSSEDHSDYIFYIDNDFTIGEYKLQLQYDPPVITPELRLSLTQEIWSKPLTSNTIVIKVVKKIGKYLKKYPGEEEIPEDLYLTYEKLVEAFLAGDEGEIRKFCVSDAISITTTAIRPSSSIRDLKRKRRDDINIPFVRKMPDSEYYIYRVEKKNNSVYSLETSGMMFWFIKNEGGSWKLYKYSFFY